MAFAAGALVEAAVEVKEAFGVVFGGVGEPCQDGAGVDWSSEGGRGCEEDREESSDKFAMRHDVDFRKWMGQLICIDY